MRITQAKQSILGGLVLLTAPVLFIHDPLKAFQMIALWLLVITLSIFLLIWI